MQRNRFLVLAVTFAATVTIGAPAVQAACTLPFQLTNGQTADATQVMSNFNALVACLNSAAPGGATNAVQFNAGNGSLGGVGPLTSGQVIIGATGGAPQAQTLTAGAGIAITNGAGSVTIAATGGGGGLVPTAASVSTSGNAVTISDATLALKIVSAAVGNDGTKGSIIHKPVSGNWSAKFKLSDYRYLVNFTNVGVAALESSTGKLFAASHQFNQFVGGPGVALRTDTATSIAAYPSSTLQSLRWVIEFPNYWKLQSDGTNIYVYTSFDGENWDLEKQVALTSAFTTAPDRVGIFVVPWNADGTARPVTVYCYDFTIS